MRWRVLQSAPADSRCIAGGLSPKAMPNLNQVPNMSHHALIYTGKNSEETASGCAPHKPVHKRPRFVLELQRASSTPSLANERRSETGTAD
jgi:hypothetical protein